MCMCLCAHLCCMLRIYVSYNYFLISGSPKPIRKLNLKMHTMKVTGDNVNCEGNK